jgi:hypothetical protein
VTRLEKEKNNKMKINKYTGIRSWSHISITATISIVFDREINNQ